MRFKPIRKHSWILAVAIGLLLTPALALACPQFKAADDQDDAILAQALKRSSGDSGYTIIAPITSLWNLSSGSKEYAKKQFKAQGRDVGPLIDKLIEKNQKPVRLSLKSSPEDGYLIDYEGRFDKYFDENGGGWNRLYKENPDARGMTSISLPAYDKQSGLVLLYLGTQSHWLAGSGYLVLYQYEDGKLKEMARAMLWIS